MALLGSFRLKVNREVLKSFLEDLIVGFAVQLPKRNRYR